MIALRTAPGVRRWIGGAIAVVAIGVAGAALWWTGELSSPSASPLKAAATVPAPMLIGAGEVPPLLFKPLTEVEALAANAATPISTSPNPPATPFTLPVTDTITYQRGLDCMTTAIYFEAGYEPGNGRAAVAQVILNRMRHPAFPKTICGVVFQGSERVTGCQFSFTCDGALLRVPNRLIWEEARRTAERALAGYVEPTVGWATHYHADYVVPYWGPSLVKTAIIGAHIFYRLQPGIGSPRNFTGIYAGDEPAIALMIGFSSEVPVTVDTVAVEHALDTVAKAVPISPLDIPEIRLTDRNPVATAGNEANAAPATVPTPGAALSPRSTDGYFPTERRQRRSRLPM